MTPNVTKLPEKMINVIWKHNELSCYSWEHSINNSRMVWMCFWSPACLHCQTARRKESRHTGQWASSCFPWIHQTPENIKEGYSDVQISLSITGFICGQESSLPPMYTFETTLWHLLVSSNYMFGREGFIDAPVKGNRGQGGGNVWVGREIPS